MIWLFALSLLQLLIAQTTDFCIPDVTKRFGLVCFTNWPEIEAVCPNHPFEGGKLHGRIAHDSLAEHLYLNYPLQCSRKDTHGKQRCTTTIWSKTGKYASLWADRSITKEGYPSYCYGGLSWFKVSVFRVPFFHQTNWNQGKQENWCLRCPQDHDCNKYTAA